MIHEIRTYQLQSGTTPQFLAATGAMVEKRIEYSPLIGFFYTEVGQLNQVVHIWQYDDLNHRTEIRANVVEDGIWPPDNADITITQQSDIYIPAPFMPEVDIKRDIGPLFELRIYRYPAGTIPKVIEAWSENFEARNRLSPAVGVWYTEIGNLNLWAHMWAYESYEHRTDARKEFAAIGWPPKSGVSPLHMQNMLLIAADFSPVRRC